MGPVKLGNGIASLRGSHSYGIVFVLVLTIIMATISIPAGTSGRGASIVALAAMTLAVAVWVSGTTARAPKLAAGLALFAALAAVVSWLTPGIEDEAVVTTRFVVLAVVIVLPFVIGEGSFRAMREEGVTLGVVFGAVSIYLLIALAFAVIYAIVGDIASTPFFTQAGDAPFAAEFADYMYFSVVTQTTVGYGDLTPATGAARAFAAAQGLMGQLYLVSVVAVVVGNFGRGTDTERELEQRKLAATKEELGKLVPGQKKGDGPEDKAPPGGS